MTTLVTNNAYATLASGITAGATALTLSSGQGARFPVVVSPDIFYGTLINASNVVEIVKVTARASGSDILTIVRAQDGTGAAPYSTGDRFELRPVAALFNSKLDIAATAWGGNAATATIATTATNVNGLVGVANGGTGATTAVAALAALGGAPLASPTFTGPISGNGNLSLVSGTNTITATLGNSGGYFYGSPTEAGWFKASGAYVRWNTTTGLVSTNGGIATGGASSLSSAGLPLTINSTDGTNIKVWFQDNGVGRGYIGANASLAFYAINASNNAVVLSVDNVGNGLAAGSFTSPNIYGPSITQTSDERKKTNWRDMPDDFLANLGDVDLVGLFDWIDTGTTAMGIGAQSLESFSPTSVHTDPDGFKSVNYGSTALVAVVLLIREVKRLRAALEAKMGPL